MLSAGQWHELTGTPITFIHNRVLFCITMDIVDDEEVFAQALLA